MLKNTVLLRTQLHIFLFINKGILLFVVASISLSISSRGQLGNHFKQLFCLPHTCHITFGFVHLECEHKGLYPLKRNALALGGHGPT